MNLSILIPAYKAGRTLPATLPRSILRRFLPSGAWK